MDVLNKTGIAVSVFVAAVMSSCSDKGYWEEAPLVQAYSFEKSSYSSEIAPGANEIELTLVRTIADARESVDVTFTPAADCPSDIKIESPVMFEAGSFTSVVVLKIENATPPYTYAGTVGFVGEVSYSGTATCTLNCPVNYTWTSLGSGTFLDAWVMDDSDPFSVEILKADGFERYRVMNPYKEYYESEDGKEDWEDWIASGGPEYVEFWENDDETLSFNSYSSGLMYQATAGQPINVYPWSSFSNGVEGYDIWYENGFAVLSPIYYIPGVGGFGQQQYSIQIELPK